jgi:hypothetical protein
MKGKKKELLFPVRYPKDRVIKKYTSFKSNVERYLNILNELDEKNS